MWDCKQVLMNHPFVVFWMLLYRQIWITLFQQVEIRKMLETRRTPWKINIESKNHPIEKEIHLPNLHLRVPAVNFAGCNRCTHEGFLWKISGSRSSVPNF